MEKSPEGWLGFQGNNGPLLRVLIDVKETDAWMHDSPFYQNFSEVGRIEVETTVLEAQGPPLDAWMHDSHFYQDFSDVVG